MPASASYDAIAAGKLVNRFKCMLIGQMNTIHCVTIITMRHPLLAVSITVPWRVHMDWCKKAILFLLFSVGALACIGTVLALVPKLGSSRIRIVSHHRYLRNQKRRSTDTARNLSVATLRYASNA